MHDLGEQLEAVDQARAGPGKVGRGVYGHHSLSAQGGERLCIDECLGLCTWGVIAAGHHDHELGLGRCEGLPAHDLRGFTGEAEHVVATGELDQLGSPVTGHEDRIEPLECGDARAGPAAHGELHTIDARGDRAD